MSRTSAIEQFLKRLARCPPYKLAATLVRRVPWVALGGRRRPDFLFTSGRPNRYNLAETACLYLCDNDTTAQGEYEDGVDPLVNPAQPVVVFRAKMSLVRRPAVDLLDAETRRVLGLTPADLFADWRQAKPIATQWLGEAVARARTFSAIRYPSRAAQQRQRTGFNVVVFRDCVAAPDAVEIVGPKGALQRWP